MGNIRVFNKTISYQVEGSLETKIYCFKSQWLNLNLTLKDGTLPSICVSKYGGRARSAAILDSLIDGD